MSKVMCFLFGHRYCVTKRFSRTCRQVGCSRCGRLWGMHDAVQAFVPWDADLEKLHGVDGVLKAEGTVR